MGGSDRRERPSISASGYAPFRGRISRTQTAAHESAGWNILRCQQSGGERAPGKAGFAWAGAHRVTALSLVDIVEFYADDAFVCDPEPHRSGPQVQRWSV